MRLKSLLILAAAGLLLRPSPASAQARLVDCVAAVVNGDIISRFDVDVAEAFRLFPAAAAGKASPQGDTAARRAALLEHLIDQKLVLDQFKPAAAPPDPEATDAEWRGILARAGADAVRKALDRFGMTEADLRPYLEARALYRRILDNRFRRTVSVSLREIEAYYEETYTAARKAEGREPRPLVEVLDALEAEIKKTKVEAAAAAWIDALRDQADVEIRADCLK